MWFEDALGSYGVNTVVFDLHIVVSNIESAAAVLLQQGWAPYQTRKNDCYSFLWNSDALPYRSLLPPDWVGEEVAPWPPLPRSQQPPERQPVTVLLSSAFWEVPSDLPLQGSLNPPLSTIADSLIARLLDSDDGGRLQRHLAMQVSGMYDYVDQVKQHSFADSLSHVHRQFHLDACGGENVTTIPGIKRQREKVDALLHGAQDPQATNGAVERLRSCARINFSDSEASTNSRSISMI